MTIYRRSESFMQLRKYMQQYTCSAMQLHHDMCGKVRQHVKADPQEVCRAEHLCMTDFKHKEAIIDNIVHCLLMMKIPLQERPYPPKLPA